MKTIKIKKTLEQQKTDLLNTIYFYIKHLDAIPQEHQIQVICDYASKLKKLNMEILKNGFKKL